ncbi:MAG: hypothetical protein KDJ88_19775 [Bauldia sp.]|nr:hypothetical protein [Bauldia sp.]
MRKPQLVPLLALAFTVAGGAALAIADGNMMLKSAGDDAPLAKTEDAQPLLDQGGDVPQAKAGGKVDDLFADAAPPRIKAGDDGEDGEHFDEDFDD